MRWLVFLYAALAVNNVRTQQLDWSLNSPVTDLTVGPTDAVHCKVSSPRGATVFDGFGQCRVNIDRVTAEHDGVWTLEVTQPSNVIAATQEFTARVTSVAAEPKLVVATEVVTDKPLVTISCRVSTAISACVFRDPSGQVLQSRQGVSEDRYSYGENTEAGTCSLQINDPLTQDLGLWRCDLQTSTDTYYGHITVLCPWAMQVPEIAAAVVSEPTLTSQTQELEVLERETATMSCLVQSAIRYCYFRARNGTVFSVRPGISSPIVEYVGAGLDAGECGARFTGLLRSDSGTWSCHVGLPDNAVEQRAQIAVTIQGPIAGNQYLDGHDLVVEGLVFARPSLEYCRFVRIDGLGFTSENVPEGYVDYSSISQGICRIRIASPTILDHHPWTVVAKTTISDEEYSDSTVHTLTMPPEFHEPPPSRWWIFVLVAVAVVGLATVFAFKRHRRWAAARASNFTNSFRKPVVDEIPEKTVPV